MRKTVLAFCLAAFASLLALGGGGMMIGARTGAWAKSGGGLPHDLILLHSFNGDVVDEVSGLPGSAFNASFGEDANGKYIHFVGGQKANSYFLSSNINLAGKRSLTIEAWVKVISYSAYGNMVWVGHEGAVNGLKYSTSNTSGGSSTTDWSCYKARNTNGDMDAYHGLFPYTLNSLYHVSFTFDYNGSSSSYGFYKRDSTGSLLSSKTTTGYHQLFGIDENSVVGLNSWGPGTNDADATADFYGLRLWNRVLSSNELRDSAIAGPKEIVIG